MTDIHPTAIIDPNAEIGFFPQVDVKDCLVGGAADAAFDNQLQTMERLIAEGVLKPMDPEAVSRLLNGAALNAALWIAASEDPEEVLPKAIEAFRSMATGLLA